MNEENSQIHGKCLSPVFSDLPEFDTINCKAILDPTEKIQKSTLSSVIKFNGTPQSTVAGKKIVIGPDGKPKEKRPYNRQSDKNKDEAKRKKERGEARPGRGGHVGRKRKFVEEEDQTEGKEGSKE